MARVLIIDDSGFQRRRIRKMVENLGHECEEAEDGFAGLKMVESAAPECILLDLIMPRCTGTEFLVAAGERGLTTPIIVLTSDIQQSVRRQCLELGARAVLNKPPKESQLKQEIAQALAPAVGHSA